MNDADSPRPNFIRDMILADNASGKHGGTCSHALSARAQWLPARRPRQEHLLNFGLAEEFGGKCNLRFDDTNPTKEEKEYVESIIEDVKWLGGDLATGSSTHRTTSTSSTIGPSTSSRKAKPSSAI